MEKCCNSNGQFWCSPLWQSCYGNLAFEKFQIDQKELQFEDCKAEKGADDTHLGRFAGSTGKF